MKKKNTKLRRLKVENRVTKQGVSKRISTGSGNYIDKKSSRLWCNLVVAVSLYGVLWLFVSTRIDVKLPAVSQEQEPPRQNKRRKVSLKEKYNNNENSKLNANANSSLTSSQVDDIDNEKTFLNYQLHYDKPYNVTYGQHTQCKVGIKYNKWGRKPIRRVALSHPLKKVLDVTTTVQTNLKIITVGDSVGIQFHELFEEALEPPTIFLNGTRGTANKYHVVYQNAWGDHESVSVSAPTSGGGVLAAFRMTGLLLHSGKNEKPPNEQPNGKTGAGGWLPEHVHQIINHSYADALTTPGKTAIRTVDSFDVILFRIPHGWLPLNLITRESIEESMILARDLFSIKTAIIPTLFLNNNVITMEDLIQMKEKNEMIRDLVEASWANDTLPDLLLMDFGGWTDQLTSLNAKLAGMNRSAANYTLERLGCARFPPNIAMSCAIQVKPGSCTCERNMMSIDGMHWCMETLGGRIIAVYACLLQCSLLPQQQEGNDVNSKKILFRDCQKRCNDEFMSLRDASSLSTTVANSPRENKW